MTSSSLIKEILANFDRVPTYQAAAGNRSRIAGLKVEDSTSELWPLADEMDLEWRLYILMIIINIILGGGQSPPRVAHGRPGH